MTAKDPSASRVSILVHGGTGRLGTTFLEVAARSEDVEVTGILELRQRPTPPVGPYRLFQSVSPESVDVDIVVDFSVPEALGPLVEMLRGAQVKLVCGTTGLGSAERDLLKVYSQECAVFYDENMSYGVSVMKRMLETAGPLLRDVADVEIIEMHHRAKRDYPSGTAYALSEIIDPGVTPVCGRTEGATGEKRAIHIHSARIGNVPGEHQVVFASTEELITVSHRALSRDVFAKGALLAAKYLVTQSKGMFSMKDLVGAQHG